MTSKNLRTQARQSLNGKWGVAVAVSFVATLLNGTIGVPANSSSATSNGYLDTFMNMRLLSVVLTVGTVMWLIRLVVGGAITLGSSSFYTKMVKGEQVRFGDLFGYFHQLWRGFCMQFLMGLFVCLWSLLLVIPGIVAAYSYAMTPYLMAEFQDLGTMDALRESKRLMKGNRFRLFCLHFSFIGWAILAVLTFGIGDLWLSPYVEAATAAFYMDVTGRSEETFGQQPNGFDPTYQGPEF